VPLSPAERVTAQRRFLDAYRNIGIIRAALHESNLDRSTVDAWRKKDAQFAEAFAEARQDAGDILVLEAYRRGVEGIEEPLINNGRIVTKRVPVVDRDGMEVYGPDGKRLYIEQPVTVRKYSDRMLELLLRAGVAEFAAIQQHQVSGRIDGEVTVTHRAVFLMPKIVEETDDGWPEPLAEPDAVEALPPPGDAQEG